jgi:hypothetical protein
MTKTAIYDPLQIMCIAVAYVIAEYKYGRGQLLVDSNATQLDEYVMRVEEANKELSDAIDNLDRAMRKNWNKEAA